LIPNGDGNNDYFIGTGLGIVEYEMWIFDRWGNMIYYTDNIAKPWDGTVEGKSGEIVQIDTYVWRAVVKDVFNKTHKYIGHVNVIK
jgi:gliding motility-associated-like protein